MPAVAAGDMVGIGEFVEYEPLEVYLSVPTGYSVLLYRAWRSTTTRLLQLANTWHLRMGVGNRREPELHASNRPPTPPTPPTGDQERAPGAPPGASAGRDAHGHAAAERQGARRRGIRQHGYLASAELYDPASEPGAPRAASPPRAAITRPRCCPTARCSSRGDYGNTGYLASAELYDPATALERHGQPRHRARPHGDAAAER